MTTSTWPAGQSSTPPVVPSGLLLGPPLLPEPKRICSAVTHSAAYAMPLTAPATRSFVSSLASGPWPSAARMRRQEA